MDWVKIVPLGAALIGALGAIAAATVKKGDSAPATTFSGTGGGHAHSYSTTNGVDYQVHRSVDSARERWKVATFAAVIGAIAIAALPLFSSSSSGNTAPSQTATSASAGPGTGKPADGPAAGPPNKQSIIEPLDVERDGVEASVSVLSGRDDSVVGDVLVYDVTIEVFRGSWRFRPEFIVCGGDAARRADIVYASGGSDEMRPATRRFWKVGCGHAIGGAPVTVSVYFKPGVLLATWT